MLRPSLLSIRFLLLLIIFVVALPAAGVILYSGIEFRNAMLEEARQETLQLSERIATEQRNLVVAAEQLVTSLAQLPEVKERDKSKVEPILRDLLKLNPMYANITIADRRGMMWASAAPMKQRLDLSNRRFFKSAITSGRLSSGEYIVSRIITKPIFNLGYPLKDQDGRSAGVIGVSINIGNYQHLLQQMNLPSGFSFVILDHKGIILARGIDHARYVGKPYPEKPFRNIQQGPDTGTEIRPGLQGDNRIISYRKLRLPGEATPYMYVTAGIPTEVATREASRALTRSMVLLSSVLLLACGCAILIGKRSIGDRIRVLEDASERLAGGDAEVRVSALVVGGELGSLALTFDAMAEQLRAREEALARSEAFLNTIIQTEPECVKLLDRNGCLEMMNHAGLAMIDAESLAQVQGECMYPLVTPEYRDAFIELTNNVFRGATGNLVFEAVGLKGRRVWLDTHAVPFRNDHGDIVSLLGITRDITEHRKSEEERRENLLLFESLMRYSPMGIRIFNGESGQCILLNQATAEIAGGRVEAMQEQNFRTLRSWQESGLLEVAEQVLDDGVARVRDVDLTTSFGKRVAMSYSLSRLLMKDKKHLLVVGRDVTDERRLEQEKTEMEAQILHVQKLESLGVLAGGIAHDFNNILMAIMGNAELALLRLPQESPVRTNLHNIEKSSQRAADLAQQMLAYSGKGRFVIEVLDINAIIKEMSHMLEVSISKKAQMRLELAGDLPPLQVDATQIRQVIMNLVINASEAIGDHNGVISVRTGASELEGAALSRLWLTDRLQEGLYVYFEVADDGCGMDQDTLGKIFDPFFTTKFTGRGLGMAAVLGIVRGHRGTIEVHSEPGRGSLFRVYLPAHQAELRQQARQEQGVVAACGSGTVLLVDDEEAIRSLGKEMLESLGYSVLTAEDGAVAIEIFQQRRDEVDCVILDLTMPHMDGEQALQLLRSLDPQVQVILSSGYSEQEITERFTGRGLAGFIQKPYRLADLGLKLQRVRTMARRQ
ncbi:response regulator [Geomonas anaerohicana]|uniref:histidine kinase n=1 Tax=Geomonas anaerohicana TaxID=2798583 RepID=A0ABS0YA77_9BACT|nr:response regulator [Geomonas anaerohicana]MBJ6749221.1 response regulator [Geomonas anaerohicana]